MYNDYELALYEAKKTDAERKEAYHDKAVKNRAIAVKRNSTANSLKKGGANWNKRRNTMIAGGATAAVGGAGAAALTAKYKQYKRAAENASDDRERRIYEAKADKYKKMALAAGGVGSAGALAAGGAAASRGVVGLSSKAHKGLSKKYNEKSKKLNESYADGYYAALCEMEEVEDIYLEGYYDAITNY